MPKDQTDEDAEKTLLEEMLEAARIQAQEEARPPEQPLTAALEPLLVTELARGDKTPAEVLIADIDAALSAQVSEILHHPEVQKLEASWRGLKYLIDRVDFDDNVQVQLLNCSKEDLVNDFEDARSVTVAGLYMRLCNPSYSESEGAPVSLIVADYEFDQSQGDVELLGKCAATAADAHAPFIANASARFFGCQSFLELSELPGLWRVFDSSRYAAWHAYQNSEDARYVGLCVPRFLLRPTYGTERESVDQLGLQEDTGSHDAFLWGSSAYAFAAGVANAFAKHRWFDRLADAEPGIPGPTEVRLTEQRHLDLAEQGLLPLLDDGEGNAVFRFANSTQGPRRFADTPEGRAADVNHRAGRQLGNVLITSRLAHFIEALGHELGTDTQPSELEQVLQRWLSQYVATSESPVAESRGPRPLREAHIAVTDQGWYRYELEVCPAHEEPCGALRLAGRLGT
jgi:type VI secretion system protein ImpC